MNPAVALTRLKISGFRVYQTHTLSADVLSPRKQPASAIVIAGTNGSGKTSVLEAILFALGQERLIHLSVAELDESAEGSHELHPRACFPAEAHIELTFQVERAPGTLFGSMTPCALLLTRTIHGRTLSLLSPDHPPMLLSKAHLDELPRLLPVQYFSSQRAPALMGVVEPSLPGPHNTKLRERYRLHRLKQQLLNERLLHSFSQTMPRDRQWLEKLMGVWRRLRPFDEAVSLELMPRDASDANKGFDLAFVQASEFGPQLLFFADDASSGELELLTLFLSLILEDFKGLLLIDEPELHLHAEWHRLLLPLLREVVPQAQVVMATHAHEPWDQVHQHQRLLLTREPISNAMPSELSPVDPSPLTAEGDDAK